MSARVSSACAVLGEQARSFHWLFDVSIRSVAFLSPSIRPSMFDFGRPALPDRSSSFAATIALRCGDRRKRRVCGRLLRFALRPTDPLSRGGPRIDLHEEDRLVRRPARLDDPVDRRGPSLSLEELLEPALVVLGRGLDGGRRGGQGPLDEGARRRESSLEVDRAADGLVEVREETAAPRSSLDPLSRGKTDETAQAEPLTGVGEGGEPGEACPPLAELARAGLRRRPELVLGESEAEDGVPQELEPVVVRDRPRLLVREGDVGERLLEQGAVAEAVSETRFDLRALLVRERRAAVFHGFAGG